MPVCTDVLICFFQIDHLEFKKIFVIRDTVFCYSIPFQFLTKHQALLKGFTLFYKQNPLEVVHNFRNSGRKK